MATVDERERDDEELADYDVGFQDRIECEPWEASPGEDLVLSKGMTEGERWLRLKALHKSKRKEPLGPGWERGWDAAHKSQKTVGKI
jgi:hypothetical protein